MKLEEVVRRLALDVCAGSERLDRTVTGGYACDLLSYVMARAREGNLWITVQGHPNVVAVASLVGLAGVIVTEGAKVDRATIEKANQEGIPIMTTPHTTFTIACRLCEMGVREANSGQASAV
jgi:predicted transcriptional regulator